jgi:hypothetical protein
VQFRPDDFGDEVMLAEVFSDACDYYGVTTGATGVIGKGIVLRVVSEVLHTKGNVKAEVLSLASGLSRVPAGRDVICYTDMPCLIPFLSGEKSRRSNKMSSEIALVIAEVARLENRVRFMEVPRKNKVYKACHRLALSLAKGVFRSQGKPRPERKPTVAESLTKLVNSLSVARMESSRN